MSGTDPKLLRFLWLLVAALLIYAGVEHMFTQTLHGRVRIDNTPLLQGGVVLLLGLLEVVLGLFLFWLHWLRR